MMEVDAGLIIGREVERFPTVSRDEFSPAFDGFERDSGIQSRASAPTRRLVRVLESQPGSIGIVLGEELR